MSFSFWLLAVRSRDLSQFEKDITACRAEQIHKMTPIFTQNDSLGPAWGKSRNPTANSQKLEDM